MGKVAADGGDAMEAVGRYREALRLNPTYDQAMNNLANILKVRLKQPPQPNLRPGHEQPGKHTQGKA